MRIKLIIWVALCMVTVGVSAQSFNGLDMNMGTLSRLSNAKTRSISPENYTGEKGKGGMADPAKDKDKRNVANAWAAAKDLGKGWKVNPFIIVKSKYTLCLLLGTDYADFTDFTVSIYIISGIREIL